MRVFLFFISLFFFKWAVAQRPSIEYSPRPIGIGKPMEWFDNGQDSFETSHLKGRIYYYRDTMPMCECIDESRCWEDARTTICLFDSSGILAIWFQDGHHGTFQFYYKDGTLLKAKVWGDKREFQFSKSEQPFSLRMDFDSLVMRWRRERDPESLLDLGLGVLAWRHQSRR